MSEQQQVQIPLEPNAYYISGINITPAEEEFVLHIVSGHSARMYTMNPKHAKRVMLLLQGMISQYEEKFGELKTELPAAPNQTQPRKVGFSVDEERKDK
jgi:hypothetical protein